MYRFLKMRNKVSQFIWLLPLLLVLGSDGFGAFAAGETSSNYDRQFIAVLENDPATLEAAHYLYGKHESTSTIMELKSGKFEPVDIKFNEQTKAFESSPAEYSPEIHDEDWIRSRIQVIGHGIIDSEDTTIGGLKAGDLAETLTQSLSHGKDVGRISIVGCTGNNDAQAGAPAEGSTPPYLSKFMEKLQTLGLTDTSVSMRSALVSVDQNGRKLTGERFLLSERIPQRPEVGIVWKHKDASNLWVGEIENGMPKFTQKEVGENTEIMPSKYFGVLPVNSPLYVSKSGETYEMSDADALKWIDETVAQQTYDNIKDQGAGPLNEVDATMLPLTTSEGERAIKVREIGGVQDLLKELVHHGETGAITGGDLVYYRYGDWAVSLDPQEFYVKVEGVIKNSNGEEEENKVRNVREKWNNYIMTELAKTTQEFNNHPGTDGDPEKVRLRKRKEILEEGSLPSDYPNMRLDIGENFFSDMNSWVKGEHSKIGLEIENAYNAQCGMATFMSESIRSFQTHITNMIGLDLARHGYLSKEYFIDTHPMARGKTWVMRDPVTGKQKTGLEMIRHKTLTRAEKRSAKVFETTKSLMARLTKSWLSHADVSGLEGSGSLPTQDAPYTGDDARNRLYDSLSSLEDVGRVEPQSKTYLRDYDLTSPLLSTKITEPEVESVNMQIKEFSNTEDISSPLRASMALANDHAYVSSVITQEVEQRERTAGRDYEVVPDSVSVEGNGAIMKFQVQEKNNPSRLPEDLTASIDTSKLESKSLMDQLEAKSNELENPQNTEGKLSKINRGLAIYGVVRGLSGAIDAFENGNINQGAIGLAQSLHGIGELSGINRAIYKASGKFLGRVLRNQVENVGEKVTTIAGEDAGRLLKSAGGEVLSTVGEVGEFLEDVPIVGTAFGIYNIYEDFQQHSTLGYIDAGLDIAITGLSLLGPEAEPIVIALTIIRMGIDTFYNGISKELNDLPPNASVGQKVGAVFKGIGNAAVDFSGDFTLPSQIFGSISNSHKLDEQYDKDRSLLTKLSNYKNYFTVVKEGGSGASEINFAGGSESWNGGDITFHLGMSGQSTLSLEDVDSNGNLRVETHTVETSGVEDIVMGIGESHPISFKKQTAKFLWFIPVHSQTLISRTSGERQTLHGTYYGNSQNNKFFAVQKLPPQGSSLGYNLHDYHYRIFGMGGDDSFYLGPQYSYVEGNDGSDAYFVDDSSVFTEINNYADDGKIDYIIFDLDYSRLRPTRGGSNLGIITPDGSHTVLIDNWFFDDTYQHMIFKTKDGVLFKVSATGTEGVVVFIPYALSGGASTQSLVFDAREREFSEVVTLTGSDHDDMIYGNGMDN